MVRDELTLIKGAHERRTMSPHPLGVFKLASLQAVTSSTSFSAS